MASDGSPWDDDPHVLKSNSGDRGFLEYLGMVTDYVSIPICLVAILVDVILIVAVLKYKRLKNRNNFYLVNFAVFHICYIVSTPLFYIVLDLFYNGSLEVHWYCVWIRVENFAMGLIFSFATGFGIDALLEKISPSWFAKYERRYVYVFSFFYFSHFLIYITAASICLKRGFANDFNFYFLTTYYFLMLAVVLYATYKEKKAEKSLMPSTANQPYALSVGVIILICWLPLFVLYNLMNIFRDVQKVEHVLWYVAFLPEYLAYFCSLVAMWKLWKSNKHFKAAFRKILKRQVADCDYDDLNTNENEGNHSL